MKIKKAKYLSIFFLLCFISSFGLSTAQNYTSKVSKVIREGKNLITLSPKENHSDNNNDLVFEKNESETESESSFHVQAIILPFLISFFLTQESLTQDFLAEPLSAKQTNPIYISVCNFRI